MTKVSKRCDLEAFRQTCNNKAAGDTDGNVGVLVKNNLKQVRWENGRGFEVLLGSEDVLLLTVRTWRRAGQVCDEKKKDSFRVQMLSSALSLS